MLEVFKDEGRGWGGAKEGDVFEDDEGDVVPMFWRSAEVDPAKR